MKESQFQREVFKMGLSPRHKGFYYLSSWLYKAAASDAGTNAQKMRGLFLEMENTMHVDRAMRTAIRYAWDVVNGEIHELFPNSKYPPAPIEFIHAMLWKIEEDDDLKRAGDGRNSK